MAKDVEEHLLNTLKRLEKATEEIRKTQGYTTEVEKLTILMEMIREQVPNEDTRTTTRQTR